MRANKTGLKEAIRFFGKISKIKANVDDEHAKTISSALKKEYNEKYGRYYSTTKQR